jgi:hypothetical protein
MPVWLPMFGYSPPRAESPAKSSPVTREEECHVTFDVMVEQRRASRSGSAPWLATVLFAAIPLWACAEGSVGAAKVVAAKGDVRIVAADGKLRTARESRPLAADDLLKVPANGFLVIELVGNGHVVRIDEDLEMRVNQLALFGAPKARVGVVAQLDALLTAEEKKGLNERMTGFYATTAAADTQPSRSKEATSLAESAPEPRPAAPAPAGPPPAVTQAQPGAVAPSATGRSEGESGKPPSKELKMHDAGQGEAWQSPEGYKALRACLAKEVRELGVGKAIGPALTIKYKSNGGTWRVVLEGALRIPPCAQDLFNKEPPPATPNGAWRAFELELDL